MGSVERRKDSKIATHKLIIFVFVPSGRCTTAVPCPCYDSMTDEVAKQSKAVPAELRVWGTAGKLLSKILHI